MKYTIGFKSGAKVNIDLDGVKFKIDDIVSGAFNDPRLAVQWYREPGIAIAVNEIEFIIPAD